MGRWVKRGSKWKCAGGDCGDLPSVGNGGGRECDNPYDPFCWGKGTRRFVDETFWQTPKRGSSTEQLRARRQRVEKKTRATRQRTRAMRRSSKKRLAKARSKRLLRRKYPSGRRPRRPLNL